MQNFDTREILSYALVVGFLAAVFAGSFIVPERFTAIKDIVLVVIAFYFGNKSALDRPGE